jgi:hypothetical protein
MVKNGVNQIELFYTNETNHIHERAIYENDVKGMVGSLTRDNRDFGTGISRMSTYWPSTIFQDGSGLLIELLYGPDVGWYHHDIFSPTNFSGLVALPNDPKFQNWNMLLQRSDLTMVNLIGNGTNIQASTYAPGPLNLKIPQSAAVAGFAVARPSDPSGTLDSFVLSRTVEGNFQMSSQTDRSGWLGPETFPALNGGDRDSNIVCLTPNAWPATNLQPNFDMSRCYFQVGGWLREVMYDGKDWKVLGLIPMT